MHVTNNYNILPLVSPKECLEQYTRQQKNSKPCIEWNDFCQRISQLWISAALRRIRISFLFYVDGLAWNCVSYSSIPQSNVYMIAVQHIKRRRPGVTSIASISSYISWNMWDWFSTRCCDNCIEGDYNLHMFDLRTWTPSSCVSRYYFSLI